MVISIGNIEVTSPVFLAPMSGVTDLPFRRLVRRFGAGLVFSEMIASRAMVEQVRGSKRLQENKLDEKPFALQLAGCEPEIMAEAAVLCEKRGAPMIDINFGCPVKKIVNKMGGSAMMKDEPLAFDIMQAVCQAVKVPVTVKMRLGWDQDNQNAASLARLAQEAGIKMVTVHGRTRCQLYRGAADWQAVRAVKENISIPLIVNGDINNGDDARMAMQLSHADGVMVGRACYGKPWKIKEIMDDLAGEEGGFIEPQMHLKKDIVLDHYDDLLSYYGERQGLMIGRKHLAWYLKDIEGAAKIRHYINGLSEVSAVKEEIAAFFAQAASSA